MIYSSVLKPTLLIGSLSVIFLSSCTRYVANPDACYNDQVKKILVNNCATAGCHNPSDKKEGLDFTSYEGVMQAVKAKHSELSKLYTALNGKGEERMPRDYELSKADKNIIKNWINNGALNNSCTETVCDSSVFSYSKVNTIIQNNCINCHNKNNVSGGILLDTYSNVVAAQNDKERFINSIKHIAPFSAMPKYGSALSNCDVRVIEKWIDDGMKDN